MSIEKINKNFIHICYNLKRVEIKRFKYEKKEVGEEERERWGKGEEYLFGKNVVKG